TPDRDELTGTSESDRLTGGFGADILTGEGGSDQFIYESIRDAGDTITDFEIGSDQIVLTGLLDSFGYDGSDALADGYVQVVEMGSNSAVQIDADGPDGRGIFRPFILVENLAAADLSAASNFAF
ncbi:type I secretion C-terminal target domain-containing protein, partial [Coleofasciculus sp.]|uniref:type I secretion C-terminal target domain-containing protein n=1 Tax=Coleofasciculus sp. TaxID=3100458 RepID=UPI003A402BD2